VTGGLATGVHTFAFTNGIPDDTCIQYEGTDSKETCKAIDFCQDCKKPIPAFNETGRDRCFAVSNYRKYYAKEYGVIVGAKAMKNEIYKRGPIVCGMVVTDKFIDTYTGGIYEEKLPLQIINHFVSVVGWGTSELGTEYWIVRNSWGNYWGDAGFFNIKIGSDNLFIEADCSWSVPDL